MGSVRSTTGIGRVLVAAGAAAGLMSLSASAAAAMTVSGQVLSHPTNPYAIGTTGAPAPNRRVVISTFGLARAPDPDGGLCDVCQVTDGPAVTAYTDAAGQFTATVQTTIGTCNLPQTTESYYDPEVGAVRTRICHARTEKYFGFQVTSSGGETTGDRLDYWDTIPASVSGITLTGAPYMTGPTGKYWARRIGTGKYPVAIIEGFDPTDGMKSIKQLRFLWGSEVTGYATVRGLVDGAEQPVGGGLLQYLLDNNYTVWLLNSGTWGGASIRGTTGTNGLAFEAMGLIRSIHDTHHAAQSIVVGGYSMGGLVAQAALSKWCSGAWGIDPGCEMVSMWFAADSPLRGAMMPVSMLRYAHDNSIVSAVGASQKAKLQSLDSPAAREMLLNSIDITSSKTPCNTNCKDLGGCDSWEGDFKDGCHITGVDHKALVDWIGGSPRRASGGFVPSIALSVGSDATPVCTSGALYFVNRIGGAGDHELYTDTADGIGECYPGSTFDTLAEMDMSSAAPLDGYLWDLIADSYQIDIIAPNPTFIPTWSSLYYKTDNKDYWHNTANYPHDNPLPTGAANFLAAWTKEYLKGKKDKPLCSDPAGTAWNGTPLFLSPGGHNGLCRNPVCGDGRCEGAENRFNCSTDCLSKIIFTKTP